LETIRDFARERLREGGEEEDARRRHAATYLALAEVLPPEIWRPSADHEDRLDRFERERENVWAALDCVARDADPLDGLRWGAALGWFWWWRAYGDAAGRETSGMPAARRLAHLARARALVG